MTGREERRTLDPAVVLMAQALTADWPPLSLDQINHVADLLNTRGDVCAT
jgi:hypothetical protein